MSWLPLLVLCLGALAGLPAAARELQDPPFDLFLFVRSYSPGFCSETECTARPFSAFSMHGLWPENENGGYPQFCKGSQAAGPPLDNEAMRCEWESFKGTNEAFWDHEWERHGTCAEPITGNRANYFQTALQLNRKFDLDVALAAEGILPSNTQRYTAASVRSAVAKAYGYEPALHCGPGGVIVEAWMCLGLDLHPRACPPHIYAGGGGCGATVRLPLGDPVSTTCRKYYPHTASNASGASMAASDGGMPAQAPQLRYLLSATALLVGSAAVAVGLLWASPALQALAGKAAAACWGRADELQYDGLPSE